jgi:hypothetical protein
MGTAKSAGTNWLASPRESGPEEAHLARAAPKGMRRADDREPVDGARLSAAALGFTVARLGNRADPHESTPPSH